MVSPPRISVPKLDGDSLLNIFYFCLLSVIGQDENGNILWEHWGRERWWNKLIHVCRRWRYLILGSALRLNTCLVCTRGALFPPIIDYDYNSHDLIVGDEVGIMLAP